MELINIFLANPVVGLVGYGLSFIAACLAIWQFIGKSKALSELNELKIEFTKVKEENTRFYAKNGDNKNNVQQGRKSQYFQDNSGNVSIDNRG